MQENIDVIKNYKVNIHIHINKGTDTWEIPMDSTTPEKMKNNEK